MLKTPKKKTVECQGSGSLIATKSRSKKSEIGGEDLRARRGDRMKVRQAYSIKWNYLMANGKLGQGRVKEKQR